MHRPEFHRFADRELNEAAQYYELESPGLGLAFLKEVERCLQLIVDHPEAGTILRGSVRRRLVRRFPYALLYKVKPDGSVFSRFWSLPAGDLAGDAGRRMNLKRRPSYWVSRE